jgi:cell division protein FtsI (penicillin-binding protein 3)
MLDRVVALLAPALDRPGAVLVDATLGLGGHSEAFLQACPQARLVGLDRDPNALRLAGERLAPYAERVTWVHAVYDELPRVLADLDIPAVDGILFDLGVSSMQLDETDRGFAYAQDAPLDMRMDDTAPTTAADILNSYSSADLARILFQYGEEKFARRIADRIVAARETEPFTTSARLSELVRNAIPQAARRTGGHPAKRTFQALRIEVNAELDVLRRALPGRCRGTGRGGPHRGDELPLPGGPDRQADAGRGHPQHRARRPAGGSGRARTVPAAAHPRGRAADRGRGRGQPAGRLGPGAGRRAGPGERTGGLMSTVVSPDKTRAVPTAKPAPAQAQGPKLRVVYGAPFRPPRMPFVLFVVVLLAAGLVGLLLLNTELQRGTFEVTKLNQQADQLRDDQEQLERQVRTLESPQNLADRALRMGMVPNPNPVFLRLSDGKVLGVPAEGKAGTGKAMFGPGVPLPTQPAPAVTKPPPGIPTARPTGVPTGCPRVSPPSGPVRRRPHRGARRARSHVRRPASRVGRRPRRAGRHRPRRQGHGPLRRPGDDRMTERRGDEPPRGRGDGSVGRGDPSRKKPVHRPSATEGGRVGAAGGSPSRPAPRRPGTGEPPRKKAAPVAKRTAADRTPTGRAPADRTVAKRPAAKKPAADNAKKPAADKATAQGAVRKTAASKPAAKAPARRGEATSGRPTPAGRRPIQRDGSSRPGRAGAVEQPPARKRVPSTGRRPSAGSRRPPAPRQPRPKRPPRTVKLGRPALRLKVAFGVMAFVLSLFAGRLVLLQGVDPDSYALAAAKENTKPFVLHASRGSILDRNGVPLAVSEEALAITADPSQTAKDATELARLLTPRLPSTTYDKLLALLSRKGRFVYLAEKVSPQVWTQISADLKERNKDRKSAGLRPLRGLYTEADPIRSYPNGTIAANVLGVVGDEEKGLAGLEYGLNNQLSGEDGKAMYEVDTKGNQIPNANHTVQEPKPGLTAQLTLDVELQWFSEKRIEQAVKQYKAQSGAVVTVDTLTSEILAMANYPTYDPNKPVQVGALKNPALEQVYEPGSVQKVVTMAALADAGLISLDTKLSVPGALPVQGATVRDHFDHGTLRMTMAGVIAKSSNVGTIIAAQQMPRAEFVAYLHKFGFGKPTGIDFPGESRGLMPPGDEWSELTRSNVAFGQGLSANAVQMTAAVSAVANGGVYVPPKLVKNYLDANGMVVPHESEEPRRVVSASAAKQVTTMMEAVTGEGGTARQAAIPGYRVAGKTGTAQQVDSACSCYRKWATSFAGFAPADNPRFVTYVVLQNPTNGRSGGGQGGPVFRDVMSYALQKYAVPPTGSSRPPSRSAGDRRLDRPAIDPARPGRHRTSGHRTSGHGTGRRRVVRCRPAWPDRCREGGNGSLWARAQSNRRRRSRCRDQAAPYRSRPAGGAGPDRRCPPVGRYRRR